MSGEPDKLIVIEHVTTGQLGGLPEHKRHVSTLAILVPADFTEAWLRNGLKK